MPRIGCWEPDGSDAASGLGQGFADYEVLTTKRIEEAATWLEQDCVATMLLAVSPDESKLPIVEELAGRYPRIPLIALVHAEDLRSETVSRRIADCCHDYHTLPMDLPRLRITVGHAVGLYGLRRAVDVDHSSGAFYGMVGESKVMQALFRNLRKVAAVNAPVLISGESGTGKELAAWAVHRSSPARDGPFVVVNCGAIPATLIAAELFGYERGAFTGAERRRHGRLEQADGGTVFLDEIADLPLDLQSHLLRFLQEGTVDRLGGSESVAVHARVIAATHMDLIEAVRAERLREDLYYRLNVLNLHMPALRERREDIPLLANHFLEKFRREHGGVCCGFTPQALENMECHDWPGNIRELINRVRRAVVMSESRLINSSHIGLERRQNPGTRRLKTLQEARRSGEQAAILAALRDTNKNVSAAARRLDVSRVTLYRLMERHGIELNERTDSRLPAIAGESG